MKTSIVPAQITSLEDTIAGNLTLTQLILLVVPVFVAALLLTVLPPMLKVDSYKLVVLVVLGLPFVILSLRLKGQLLFHTLLALVAFKNRPRLYLATKFSEPCQFCATKLVADEAMLENSSFADRPANDMLPLSLTERSQLDLGLSTRKLTFLSDRNGNIHAVIE